jgi:hypothetical protein
VQLTSDGLRAYIDAVGKTFGAEIDFARLRHAGAIAGIYYEASRLPLSEEEQTS